MNDTQRMFLEQRLKYLELRFTFFNTQCLLIQTDLMTHKRGSKYYTEAIKALKNTQELQAAELYAYGRQLEEVLPKPTTANTAGMEL